MSSDNKRRLLIVLMVLSFVALGALCSCKSTKTTDTTFIKDSIRTNKEITIVKNSADFIRFNQPCDSLGNLRPIFYEKTTGSTKTSVTSENGSIVIATEQKQDTIKETEYIYKDKLIFKDKIKTIEKRYIPYWIWYSLWLNLLLLVWIFKKPLLNLIKPF